MQAVKTAAIHPAVQIHQTKPEVAPPLSPVADNDQIMRVWNNFNELKLRLLDDNDFVTVGGEKLAKKSAFRKLALAFGISTEIVKEERVTINGFDAFLISIKAIAPSGRFMVALGSCYEKERKFNKPSDVRAIAETRATNRSIANLIGWSAPSAEEMIIEDDPVSSSYPDAAASPAVDLMTERQKSLLVQLINQRNEDPDERENALGMIEGLSKADASSLISEMLRQNAA
ncbi:MAG: hypothetical protein PHS79_03405 [Patescibacteria group bacterium]|nr:hypothetical protein [Patescibacteria group bacterium]